MLYISTGDGTSDSDNWVSGQTLDDLLGGVLRIDISETSEDEPYRIEGSALDVHRRAKDLFKN